MGKRQRHMEDRILEIQQHHTIPNNDLLVIRDKYILSLLLIHSLTRCDGQ